MPAIQVMQQAIDTYASLQSFEDFLGNPSDAGNPFSFPALMALDEDENFPHEQMAALSRWGLGAYYVPVELEGKMRSFEEIGLLSLVLANRDMALAISHSITFLGCITVWLAPGTPMRASIARQVLSGATVAFGLTEQAHGSDISRTDTSLSEAPGGLVLDGEKWAINMASHCQGMAVFCKERRAGEDLASLVYFDRRQAAAGSHVALPRIRTLGVRAAHIGGIRFLQAALDPACRIGEAGDGMALALKGLALSRSLITGMAIGTADRALRVALTVLASRTLYGAAASDIAHVRQTLAGAFVDLLVCQALTMSALRGIHVVPEQLSISSAIVKYQVPALTEQIFDRLMFVMGAAPTSGRETAMASFRNFSAIIG